ncbi:MAG: ABC-type transport auxiliary lipoprotein family protein [Pseudomonadota bacterium]
MKPFATFLLVALLAACASTPPTSSYYLLRSDAPVDSRALHPDMQFGLSSVDIAPYLDQPGLVLMTAEGDMRQANYHLWAEPLYQSVQRLLLTDISKASGRDLFAAQGGRDQTLINVSIDQLHGTFDGRAVLVAYWSLAHNGDVLASFQYSEYRRLSDSGYRALVEAERELLSDLAADIAQSMDELREGSAKSAAE